MAMNLPKISVGQTLETLIPLAKKNWKKPVMLWGPPGIGKTSIAARLARILAAEYLAETKIDISGKNFRDLSLTTIERVDLRGLPYFDHEKKQSVFYPPAMLPQESHPGVIFIDEITRVDLDLLPSVYSLLQERRIGAYDLPDNYIIIAAGNGAEHGAVSHEMEPALADRFIHFNVVPKPDEWIDHMVDLGAHPLVCTYIKKHGDRLERCAERIRDDKLLDASPRGWEGISDLVKIFDPYTPDGRIHIERTVPGILGEYSAAQFFEEIDSLKDQIDARVLFAADKSEVSKLLPKTLSGLYNLCFAIPPLIKDKKTAVRAFDIYYAIRGLDTVDQCPVMEISTWGMDRFFKTAVEKGYIDALLAYEPYRQYRAERKEQGLE